MDKGAGHHVLWEGKYITQGCAASVASFPGRGGSMQSSRRGLLRMSFAVVPAVFLRFQDSATQSSTRGKRRSSTPDDASNGENAANFPAGAANKAMLEERQKSIKKDVEKLYDLALSLKMKSKKQIPPRHFPWPW